MIEKRITGSRANTMQAANSGASAPAGFSVGDIIGILRRRKALVFGITVTATALAALVLMFVTPRYTAEALVIVEGGARNVAGVEPVVAGLSTDAETVEGEAQILRSRELAERTVLKLELQTSDELGGSAAWIADQITPLQLADVVNRFRDRLRVAQLGRSRVISVRFSSSDPALAAQVANTVVELYLTGQLESKFRATQTASAWLDERVRDLSAKAEQSERAVEAFRRRAGLLQNETVQSDFIRGLRTQESELQRKLAELTAEYGERHPKLVSVRAELANLRGKLDSELNLNAAQVQLRALEREAESNRVLLGTYLSRLKETSSQEDIKIQQPDARIASRAAIPADPSFPKTWLILALVAAGAGFVGVVAALIAEQLDGGIRNAEELDRIHGLRSVGFSPLVTAEVSADLIGHILGYPRSAFAESLRTLRWSLKLTDMEAPTRTLLVTSAEPEEGKSSMAACIAAQHAQAGNRVLIVDADTRRPTLPQLFGLTATGPGLAEILTGRATFDEAVIQDPRSRVDILPAGVAPPEVPGWLQPPQMATLFGVAQTRDYDLIVLDSPPVLVAVDSCVLASSVEATLLVARWQATRREAVQDAARKLADAGARLAGGLLTFVDLDRYAPYGNAGFGAYRSYLGRYYAEPAPTLRIREWRDLRQPPRRIYRQLADPRLRRELVRDLQALVRRQIPKRS